MRLVIQRVTNAEVAVPAEGYTSSIGHGLLVLADLLGRTASHDLTAVNTCAAGEQTVAVSHVNNIFFIATHSHNGTGAAIFPQIHIVLGVEGHNTLTGGTGSGVDADAIIQGHTSQTMGIGIPQIGLGKKRQLVQIINGLDVIDGDTLFFHLCPVVG